MCKYLNKSHSRYLTLMMLLWYPPIKSYLNECFQIPHLLTLRARIVFENGCKNAGNFVVNNFRHNFTAANYYT